MSTKSIDEIVSRLTELDESLDESFVLSWLLQDTSSDISQLENDLLAQPNNYALHVKLIKTLTDKEKLERARETFAERFPLTYVMFNFEEFSHLTPLNIYPFFN